MSIAGKRADEFLLGKERRVKPRSSAPSGKGGRGRKRSLSGAGTKNIVSAAKKHPEVMVKITNRNTTNTGVKGVKSHIDYISRNGKIDLENNHGLIMSGKEVKTIAKDWQKAGMIEDSKKRQALNVVFSMPESTDPDKLQIAVRNLCQDIFEDHEYVMALHTDKEHPHVHVCVTMADSTGKRMNPRKNDLFIWRVKFAECLRQQGVECAATKRVHRAKFTKPEKQSLIHMKQRGANSWVDYEKVNALKEALKTNKRPIHPFLKEQTQSNQFVLKEYKALSKLLYADGLKTEARAVSQLAKELEKATPTTQAQQNYDHHKPSQVMTR